MLQPEDPIVDVGGMEYFNDLDFEERRFLVESSYESTICLDMDEGEIFHITKPLLRAIPYLLYVLARDVDALVDVYANKQGLAMAGLLKAHGVNVVSSHHWEEEG